MKITACNETFYNAATWYAHALGIADHEFDLTIDYGDDMIGAAQILYHKGVAVITMNTTQDESDNELELLAHEMVHLKQYVTGQMIDLLLTGVAFGKARRMMPALTRTLGPIGTPLGNLRHLPGNAGLTG